MEDIFEILIYLFIIVSFVSSFIKKKKKQQIPKSQISNVDSGQIPIKKVELNAAEEQQIDIFKDLEKFFQVGDTQKKTPKEHNDEEMYEGAEGRVDYKVVPEKSFHKRTSSEHTFVDPWEMKRMEIEKQTSKINKSIEEKALKFEKYLQIEETAATQISKQIRSRFANPASLKDYIIISEIMGKPRALNKRKFI